MDLVLDSIAGKVYVSCGGVRVYDAPTDTLVAGLDPGRSPWALAWNWRNRRVYVADLMDNFVCTIRDTSTAVAEPGPGIPLPTTPVATVSGRSVTIRAGKGAALLDISGRRLARLAPGANDLGGVPRGVYFVRLDGSGRTTKVVLGR